MTYDIESAIERFESKCQSLFTCCDGMDECTEERKTEIIMCFRSELERCQRETIEAVEGELPLCHMVWDNGDFSTETEPGYKKSDVQELLQVLKPHTHASSGEEDL